MSKHLRIVLIPFALAIIFIAVMGILAVTNTPDSIKVERGSDEVPQLGYMTVLTAQDGQSVQTLAQKNQEYDCTLRLFGIIPVKNIHVTYVEPKSVLLSGHTFGLRLYTRGVMVIGLAGIDSTQGTVYPAEDAGICVGDIVTHINGLPVSSIAQVSSVVESGGGGELELTVENFLGERRTAILCPVYSKNDKCYKSGMWIRDSAAGIGTMTYYDRQNEICAGLGHGICDSDTGTLLPLGRGEMVEVNVTGVTRGASGIPGQLHGFLGSDSIGILTDNCECGVFAKTASEEIGKYIEEAYPVGYKHTVQEGKAQMLTTLPGEDEPQLYDIVIERINFDTDNPTKNMIISVTDKRIIEAAGGIVQGMSGSPIIQNGRFVAAATHVFVNTPTKGYAIFAENMLDAAG